MVTPAHVNRSVKIERSIFYKFVKIGKGEDPMQELPPNVHLLQMINAPWLSSCIHIAAKRSFADIIDAADNHQASIEHISKESKVHPIWTYAILQALAKAHIFHETERYHFKNTPLSDCLRSDHPQTLKWQASVVLSPRSLVQWSQLNYIIDEVGTSIPQRLWGKELYELFDKQDEGRSTRLSTEEVIVELEPREDFDLMLEGFAALTDTAVAQAYQFKGSVCDLGGSQGSLLAAICKHHPDVEGILFERQVVIDNLKRQQTEYPFSLVAGDFFQQVPHADIYILESVFHNWPDNLCAEILKKCAEANPDAKILVVELLMGDPRSFAEQLNILMMSEQNGKERTLEEYKTISDAAGFNVSQVYPTRSPRSIIQLTK